MFASPVHCIQACTFIHGRERSALACKHAHMHTDVPTYTDMNTLHTHENLQRTLMHTNTHTHTLLYVCAHAYLNTQAIDACQCAQWALQIFSALKRPETPHPDIFISNSLIKTGFLRRLGRDNGMYKQFPKL